jgi:hypothetical protein
VLGGVGVAGLVAAGVTGALVIGGDARVDDHCPDKLCTAEGRRDIDAQKPLLIGNAVAWGIGLASLGAGVTLVLTHPADKRVGLVLRPAPNGALGGMEGAF